MLSLAATKVEQALMTAAVSADVPNADHYTRIECFARTRKVARRSPRGLCTIAEFGHYAVGEELLEHSPAVRVGRSRWTTSSTLRCLPTRESP